jgi:hypothetical protein
VDGCNVGEEDELTTPRVDVCCSKTPCWQRSKKIIICLATVDFEEAHSGKICVILQKQDKVLRSYFAQKGGTRGQRGGGTHGQGREHVKWDMYV